MFLEVEPDDFWHVFPTLFDKNYLSLPTPQGMPQPTGMFALCEPV